MAGRGLARRLFWCGRLLHACVPGKQEPRPDHIGDEVQEALASAEGLVAGLPAWWHPHPPRSNAFPGDPISHLLERRTPIAPPDLLERACAVLPQRSHQE